LVVKLWVEYFIEYQLGYTIPVSQVNKSDGTKLPDGLNPSCEGYLIIFMGYAKFSAGVCSEHTEMILSLLSGAQRYFNRCKLGFN
jgi:hypothetical protein